MKSLARIARLGFGIALVALVVWALDSSWTELSTEVRFDWTGVPLILLGTTIAAYCTASRWKWISEQLGGNQLPFMTYFYALVLTRLVGLFTSTLAVDLVGRGVALRQGGSDRPISHATTAVVVERLYDVLLPTALLGWALFARDSSIALVASVSGFFALSVLVHRNIVRAAGGIYGRIRSKLAERRGDQQPGEPSGPDAVAPELLGTRAATTVVVASLGRYLGMWIYCFGIARSIGLDLEAIAILAATPLAQLSSLFGITPGGLGIQEIGWAGGLQLIGLAPAAILLFILAQRAAFVSSFALLSALSYPFRGSVEEGAT